MALFRSSQPRFPRFVGIEHACGDIVDLIARASIESGAASTDAVHQHLQSLRNGGAR